MNEEQTMHSLPSGWQWIELGDLCEVITGTTPPKSDPSNYGNDVPFFKPPHLWNGTIDDTEEKLSKKGAKKARVVPANTVLVTCIGNLGRTGFLKNPAAFNQQLNAILENERIVGKFIFYQAQSPKFKKQLEELASGTTVSIVNKGNFETIQIPLPPRPIQQAIVSKIEELFSELDKSIETLRLAQQQLKTYRQAVLKCAFEGKLTEEWRKENGSSVRIQSGSQDGTKVGLPAAPPESYVVSSGIEPELLAAEPVADYKVANSNGGLPDGWKWVKFKELGVWKGGGTPSKSNKSFWEGGNILWVSPKDMKAKSITDTIDKITEEAIQQSSTKLIDKGSLLFVVRSGILRRTHPVSITSSVVTVNQDIQAFTPKDDVPDYLYWFTQAVNENIRKDCSKDGTTVESIESSLLKNYLIPICSKKEQQKIVDGIESRLSVADKMDEIIIQSIQQAEVLRQSILKKAFEGKLG